MWPLLFNFGIAHWAMVDEFVNVLARNIGYLANAHPGFASRTQHGCFLFWHHDTQTRQCKPGFETFIG
jgi:hypothetical protein